MQGRGREGFSCVLVVEDNPAQLRTLLAIIEEEGFAAIGCATAAEALARVRHEKFGVAVFDLRLPDLSGTQLLEQIQALNVDVPVIINTGYGSFDSAKDAVNLGAFAYVEKAGDPAELVRHVHRAYRAHLDRYAGDLEVAVAERTASLQETNRRLETTLAELKATQQQILWQERLTAVGQLAAGIAHDFNNILTSMLGFIELLQLDKSLSLSSQETLKTIAEQGGRAARLVRQILDFSRQSVSQREPLDLVLLVKETAKLLEQTVSELIPVSVEVEPGEYTIRADAGQLQQVLTNLAVNARDAMPQGGELRIRLSHCTIGPGKPAPLPYDMPAGHWVVLAVTDTGTGMAPEVQEHIFEPFFTTKEVGKGTGLGLSQVYGIVKRHEGFVTARSQLGAGSTFTLYFPTLVAEEETL